MILCLQPIEGRFGFETIMYGVYRVARFLSFLRELIYEYSNLLYIFGVLLL
jgi:hypothetical protein